MFKNKVYLIIVVIIAFGVIGRLSAYSYSGNNKIAFREAQIELNINNTLVQLGNPILIGNNKAFIPIEEVIFYLNKDNKIRKGLLNWKFYFDNKKYLFKIGSNVVKYGNKEIKLNEDIQLVNNKVYVPLDFIEKIIQYNSTWNNNGNKIYIDNFGINFDYSWVEKNKYIAHAFGGIHGKSYTNSLEAFQYNYQKGHRVFEVDFSLTSDNQLVAVHDWSINTIKNVLGIKLPTEKEGKPLTLKEFKNQKINGKYTPLSFSDVVQLMIEYPDIYIVTDTKEVNEQFITSQFKEIIKVASDIDASVLNRIIPQIYNERMYYCIMNLYNFKSIIYTLYNQGGEFSYQNTLKFAYENGIKVITTYPNRAADGFLNDLQDRGITIYMNTYNTEKDMLPWKEKGVYGFYTDFFIP